MVWELPTDRETRTPIHWKHVVALTYEKLSRVFALSNICDAIRLYSGPLGRVRGVGYSYEVCLQAMTILEKQVDCNDFELCIC